ncbi:hypothetical protein Tco_0077692 [Tanacetum coccineum]
MAEGYKDLLMMAITLAHRGLDLSLWLYCPLLPAALGHGLCSGLLIFCVVGFDCSGEDIHTFFSFMLTLTCAGLLSSITLSCKTLKLLAWFFDFEPLHCQVLYRAIQRIYFSLLFNLLESHPPGSVFISASFSLVAAQGWHEATSGVVVLTWEFNSSASSCRVHVANLSWLCCGQLIMLNKFPFSIIDFDVIVGMDWLSKRKFAIVCHEKVVRIPLEGDEILQVHGERTQGVVKTLINTKVEFRIDLVHGATLVAKSPYRLAPLEIQELSEQLRELQDKVLELLRKEKFYAKFTKSEGVKNWEEKRRMKSRRVQAVAMTIQYGVRGMILIAQSEAFKQENVPLVGSEMDEAHASREYAQKRLLGLDWHMEKKEDESLYFRESYMSYIVGNAGTGLVLDEAQASRSPVLWAEIGESSLTGPELAEIEESSLIGPELVQETTDKVVLIKEKLKAARDHQKSCADNRCKLLEFEVGDRVMQKVSPWKGVIRFGKKGKLAPRYVGPFEILERMGPVAYRFRLLEELSGVHDTFHVSNLK